MWNATGQRAGAARTRGGLRIVRVAAGLLALAPAVADAADRHLSLEFVAYVGGISALDVGVEAGLNPNAYAVDFRFDTRGVVSWIVDWTMKAYARGALEEGQPMPANAGADSSWNGRERVTRLSYGDDGTVSVHLAPKPEEDEGTPVPDRLKRGAVDLSTALLATLEAVGRERSCNQRARVFDGRRRYDLVFENVGKGAIAAGSPAVYHGPTLLCKLSVEPVAGFRTTASRADWATGEDALIHVAHVFDGTPPVPVALEYDTGLGLLRAYLTAAAFTDDGDRQRLATNPAGIRSKIGTESGPRSAR